MLEKRIQEADKLIQELFNQYRDQIQQEVIKLRLTIEKTINEISEKNVEKEKEKREQSETILNNRLDAVIEEQVKSLSSENTKNIEIDKKIENIEEKQEKLFEQLKENVALCSTIAQTIIELENRMNAKTSNVLKHALIRLGKAFLNIFNKK